MPSPFIRTRTPQHPSRSRTMEYFDPGTPRMGPLPSPPRSPPLGVPVDQSDHAQPSSSPPAWPLWSGLCEPYMGPVGADAGAVGGGWGEGGIGEAVSCESSRKCTQTLSYKRHPGTAIMFPPEPTHTQKPTHTHTLPPTTTLHIHTHTHNHRKRNRDNNNNNNNNNEDNERRVPTKPKWRPHEHLCCSWSWRCCCQHALVPLSWRAVTRHRRRRRRRRRLRASATAAPQLQLGPSRRGRQHARCVWSTRRA